MTTDLKDRIESIRKNFKRLNYVEKIEHDSEDILSILKQVFNTEFKKYIEVNYSAAPSSFLIFGWEVALPILYTSLELNRLQSKNSGKFIFNSLSLDCLLHKECALEKPQFQFNKEYLFNAYGGFPVKGIFIKEIVSINKNNNKQNIGYIFIVNREPEFKNAFHLDEKPFTQVVIGLNSTYGLSWTAKPYSLRIKYV